MTTFFSFYPTLEDLLHGGVVFTFLIVLVVSHRLLLLERRSFLLMASGLLFMLMGSLLDVADELPSLAPWPWLGRDTTFHGVMEDLFGRTVGFLLFGWGVFHQFRLSHKRIAGEGR